MTAKWKSRKWTKNLRREHREYRMVVYSWRGTVPREKLYVCYLNTQTIFFYFSPRNVWACCNPLPDIAAEIFCTYILSFIRTRVFRWLYARRSSVVYVRRSGKELLRYRLIGLDWELIFSSRRSYSISFYLSITLTEIPHSFFHIIGTCNASFRVITVPLFLCLLRESYINYVFSKYFSSVLFSTIDIHTCTWLRNYKYTSYNNFLYSRIMFFTPIDT